MASIGTILRPLRQVHERIRDSVISAFETSDPSELAGIDRDGQGDTIYTVDAISEAVLLDQIDRHIAVHDPVVVIAEGLDPAGVVLPRGKSESDAIWRVIVDPIDGTRGLMYQKRSAWILTGVAPNKGPQTNLRDIELALQTEVPVLKQHLCDTLWAVQGEECAAERYDRISGRRGPLQLQPSRAANIDHGFATIVRFFPGARDVLADIDEQLFGATIGVDRPGKALCFEDQYISTGGQLYEMIAGHDRFIADLRPLMRDVLAQRGAQVGLCCHPYDMCTELIARSCGIIVSDPAGGRLQAPLDLETEIAWTAYANTGIRDQIEPVLQRILGRSIGPVHRSVGP